MRNPWQGAKAPFRPSPWPPSCPGRGKKISSEGHPQTPGKGAAPLCTPHFHRAAGPSSLPRAPIATLRGRPSTRSPPECRVIDCVNVPMIPVYNSPLCRAQPIVLHESRRDGWLGAGARLAANSASRPPTPSRCWSHRRASAGSRRAGPVPRSHIPSAGAASPIGGRTAAGSRGRIA